MTVIYIIYFVDLFGNMSSAGNILTENRVDRQRHYNRLRAKQSSDEFANTGSLLSTSPDKNERVGVASDAFLKEYFQADIDDANLPPSMFIINRSIGLLASGSDIRG